MHNLERYVLATNSWHIIHAGSWGDCSAQQRVSAGYTRIVKSGPTPAAKFATIRAAVG